MTRPWGHPVAELTVDPQRGRIHAEGWQSWTPTTVYRLGQAQHGPVRPATWTQGYGGSRPRPTDTTVLQGDGLLVVDPGTGADVLTVAAPAPDGPIPVIRATRVAERTLRIDADAPVTVHHTPAESGVDGATAAFADRFAAGVTVRAAPTLWSSWYQYFTEVTAADIEENVAAIADRDLPIEVIQLDDGYEREIGDWLTLSGRFSSLAAVVDRIRGTGRRAGIWLAPFLAGARSTLAVEHPDWLLRTPAGDPVVALTGWGQPVYTVDPTHPGAREYLHTVVTTMTGLGVDVFKLDFVFAAALDGVRHDPEPDAVAAYRSGMALLRAAAGPASYLLGCGAPLLPSVGLVDAMRVSADTGPRWAAEQGDLSMPGGQCPELSVPARAYQHGRFWVNDPDCLLLRPDVEHRERRAELVRAHGGLRGSSDRIAALDDWGLATTVELLTDVPPPTPFRRG